MCSSCSHLIQAIEKKPRSKSNDTVDDEEDNIEKDVEEGKIPESITMDTESESYHEEEAAASNNRDDGNRIEQERLSPSDAESVATLEVMKTAATPLPNCPGGTLEAPLSPVAYAASDAEVETDADLGPLFAPQDISPLTSSESASYDEYIPSLPRGLSIPRLEGQEERKEEDVPASEESTSSFPVTIAPNLTRQDSVLSTKFDFIDDDSTDGNVCAICLSGYGESECAFSCFLFIATFLIKSLVCILNHLSIQRKAKR